MPFDKIMQIKSTGCSRNNLASIYKLASGLPDNAVMVEIGTMYGRSAAG